MRRAALLALALALVALGAGGALALARQGTPKPTTVNVTMVDFGFKLSRQRVPVGQVRFLVVNRGAMQHDFAIGRARTLQLNPGQHATLLVHFGRAARVAYRCTVLGHAALGMKGTLIVGAPKQPPPSTATATQTTDAPIKAAVQLTLVGTFARPDLVTAPPGDTKRIFVVEQRGVIRVIDDGELKPTPFLDISDQVHLTNEPGLLGLAFAPDYADSGLFYVYFNRNEANGNVYVQEYHRLAADPDRADPESSRTLLRIVKPWENHNGGMMQFGPDGYLYIAVGDGDSGVLNPPGAFAQTLNDLLGDILRIDPRQSGSRPYTVPSSNPFVGVEGAQPEIWAYGLRNPWRFWVDEQTGDMYIGDVALDGPEEIDYEPAGKGGFNFGWPCFQGTVAFDAAAVCTNPVAPAYEYGHAPNRCAIVGGVVAHDARLPALDGFFLYSDYCDSDVYTIRLQDGKPVAMSNLGVQVSEPSSFGKDALGRIYVMSVQGQVYRIDPAGG